MHRLNILLLAICLTFGTLAHGQTNTNPITREVVINAEKLTRLYLERLKRYGSKLECVITLTEELALQQAKRADAEIAAGKYRGPLHGIPYGAKDLLATRGIRTTWGSVPYTNQVFDYDAKLIKR